MPKTDDDDTREDDTRDDQTTDDTGQDDTDDAAQRDGDDDKPGDDSDDWKSKARKWERQAKANAAKARKLDEIEAANRTEAEKLQAERDQLAQRAKAATDRAVRAEVRSAARDLRFQDPADALRLIGDLDAFTDDDGEVDEDAVTKALKKIAKDKPYLLKQETAAKSGGDFSGGTGAKSDASSMSVDDFRKARRKRT